MQGQITKENSNDISDINESSSNNDAAQSSDNTDVVQASNNNDAAQASSNNDAAQTSSNNDAAQASSNNDAAQTSNNNVAAQSNEISAQNNTKSKKNTVIKVLCFSVILLSAAAVSVMAIFFYYFNSRLANIDANNNTIAELNKSIENSNLELDAKTENLKEIEAEKETLQMFLDEFGDLKSQFDNVPEKSVLSKTEIEHLNEENENMIVSAKSILNDNANYLGINAYSKPQTQQTDMGEYAKDVVSDTIKDAVKDQIGEAITGSVPTTGILDIKDKAEVISSIFSGVNSMLKDNASPAVLDHISSKVMENNEFLEEFQQKTTISQSDFSKCVRNFYNIGISFDELKTESLGEIDIFSNWEEEYAKLLGCYEKYAANKELIDIYKKWSENG